MFEWLKQKTVPFILGIMITTVTFGYIIHVDQQDRLKERLPEVYECDVQQLPPNATNLRALGNRWLLFDMEIKGEMKTFMFRRGCYRDQADILTQIK